MMMYVSSSLYDDDYVILRCYTLAAMMMTSFLYKCSRAAESFSSYIISSHEGVGV